MKSIKYIREKCNAIFREKCNSAVTIITDCYKFGFGLLQFWFSDKVGQTKLYNEVFVNPDAYFPRERTGNSSSFLLQARDILTTPRLLAHTA